MESKTVKIFLEGNNRNCLWNGDQEKNIEENQNTNDDILFLYTLHLYILVIARFPEDHKELQSQFTDNNIRIKLKTINSIKVFIFSL